MQTLHQTTRVGMALAFMLIMLAPMRPALADDDVAFSKNVLLTNDQLSTDFGPSVVRALAEGC